MIILNQEGYNYYVKSFSIEPSSSPSGYSMVLKVRVLSNYAKGLTQVRVPYREALEERILQYIDSEDIGTMTLGGKGWGIRKVHEAYEATFRAFLRNHRAHLIRKS